MIGLSYGNFASSGVSGFTGLLDTYPNAAAAYSLRLLKSDYTGALVEIRRSSDNAVKTFYPDANNEFSLTSEDGSGTSLSTWITTDDGYVRTWYDQSGNSVDVTQTTASAQPRIILSGNLQLENSKPSMFINGGIIELQNSGFAGSSVESILMVLNQTNTNGRALTFEGGDSGLRNTSSDAFRIRGSSDVNILTPMTSEPQVLIHCYGVDPVVTYYNNTAGSSGNQGAYIGSLLTIGGGSNNMIGTIQEVILYNSDQVSNREGIATNINDFYSIY